MPHKILWHYNAKNKITVQTNQWVMRFLGRKNRRIRYRGVKLGLGIDGIAVQQIHWHPDRKA